MRAYPFPPRTDAPDSEPNPAPTNETKDEFDADSPF
jgi:hypothetical protein